MMASALQKSADSTDGTPASTSPESAGASAFQLTSSQRSSSSTNESPSPPFIHVEGVANFRDLGGYPCRPAPSSHFPAQRCYVTRRLTVFRSAQLTGITANGTKTLCQDLRVRRVYDLRSEAEVNNQTHPTGPAGAEGVERILVPVFRERDHSQRWARKYKNYTDPDEDESHGYSAGFVRAYRDIGENAGPAYQRIWEHIRDREIQDDAGSSRPEPLLFHCAAGKDRTGVFAALVLRLCGVPDEVIAWEYSITEQGLGSWRESIIAHMMKGGHEGSGVPAMTRQEAERAVGSRATNMMVFLKDVVDKEWGGVEKYMQDHCDLTAQDIDTVRRRLVVEGDSPYGDGTGYWKPSDTTEADEKGPLGLAKDHGSGREREQRVMTG
ncbi:hypothetical protein GJ744_008920 [Endocarpon pusillum]|uniref:Tyrosine specific protein phosphatases domain-containing protein n=1 Tax=Endocarpon pusillum TaxID=364733 RepID=A0A8H7EBB8_9EURO|nr:hypothetical protein GJ744_008920 [Endocarpon pusillum]